MSISTLQEKFFNKGCGTALIVIAAVAMGASMFSNKFGGNSSNSRGPNGEDEAKAAVTVGNIPIPAELFQARATEMQTQAMQQQEVAMKAAPGSLPPPDATTQAQALVRATDAVLQQAALQALLNQPPVTDAEVSAFATQLMNLKVDSARGDLVKKGKLKPGASDADLEKAMKDDLKGKTLAQVREEGPKNLLAAFKDPAKKSAVLDQFGGPILVQRLGEKLVGDDAALRDSYKSYVVRGIVLSAASGAKETPAARAQKVEADLKAGKSFEAEMDAYSNAPVAAGKKIHEMTDTVPASAIASRPELSSLVGKAPNATTPIVDAPGGGKAIYQLVSVRDDLPKDFDANKAKYRADKIRTAGTAEAEKRIKALLAGNDLKWQSPGYHALEAVAEATSMGFAFDPVAIKKAVAVGQEAIKSESPTDRRLGAQALLALTDSRMSGGAKTPEATANRTLALEAAEANGIEDPTLALELAGLYGDAKNGAKATEALLAASKANSDYGAKGQQTFGDIAAKALDLQKKGVLTATQVSSVQSQQAIWTSARAENAKAASQAKTEGVTDKLSNDAEIARQKAEAAAQGAAPSSDAAKKANADEIARQKAAAGKAPTPPKAGGSLLPPSAGH